MVGAVVALAAELDTIGAVAAVVAAVAVEAALEVFVVVEVAGIGSDCGGLDDAVWNG